MACSEGIEDILIGNAGTNRGSNVMAPEHAIQVEPLLITPTPRRRLPLRLYASSEIGRKKTQLYVIP